jgi:sugar/nucleoside kinase (ribokinase family)
VSAPPAPVVVIGDANVDLLVRLPRPGEPPAEPTLTLGGTGANAAVALRRLGAPAVLVGAIGDDGYGRFARRRLDEAGVGTAHLAADPEAVTMLVLALVDPRGERTLLGWPRRGAAQARLTSAHLPTDLIAGAAWAHTTGICLVESPGREAVLRGLALARAAGVPTSFDLNLRLGLEDGRLPPAFRDAVERAIALADVVLGSAADELPLLRPGPPAEAARALAGGERAVVARLGADGALAAIGGAIVAAPAYPVRVASTVGAGDAFNAGYIAAAVAGHAPAEALRWGNAVAALAISRADRHRGADRAEVAALLRGASDPPEESG